MKKQQIISITLSVIMSTIFYSCDGIATLLHGPEPEPPPVTYNVMFDANGASGTAPATQTVNTGTVIRLPDKGSLANGDNMFAGWSESSSGIGANYAVGASIAVTGNMFFYAQWLDKSTPQYTVTFNANGATGGMPPSSQTVYSGMSITIPVAGTLAHSGKTFGGWNTRADGGGTNYEAGTTYTVTENITLYAKWQSTVQYTVTYHANGASGTVPAAQKVDPGTEITIPGMGSINYTGRTFAGWNTNTGGTGTSYAEGAAYTVTGNVTLYAQWQIKIEYTVTYYANGANGTAQSSQTVDPGTVITLPGVGSMTYTGRTFKGWNTSANGSGTSYAEGTAYAVNASVSLHAQWESVPITPQGSTLADQLAYIRTNAKEGDIYDILVDKDIGMGTATISSMGRNITVFIHSASSADIKTIQLEGEGNLFSVDTSVTLRLQDIVLKGNSMNYRALIAVGPGGKMILNSGSKITQNTNNWGGTVNGSGIYVNGGTLEMNDGAEISDNQFNVNAHVYGCGVYIEGSGNFTMRGGIITGNLVTYWGRCWGAGVYVGGNSIMHMSGGMISRNRIAMGGSSHYYGGGICVANGSTFTKRAETGSTLSGIIYGSGGEEGNQAAYGQAVYREFGTKRERNTALLYTDEITTLSDMGWE